MKCQHCLVQEANFHYKNNINGTLSEGHLCADCAQETEGNLFAGALLGPMEMLGGLFGGSALGRSLLGGGLFDVHSPFAPPRQGLLAPVSRIPVEPGAAEGAVVPQEAEEALKQRRALNCLRQEMQTAIELEQFERAAELRDEIARLENGM